MQVAGLGSCCFAEAGRHFCPRVSRAGVWRSVLHGVGLSTPVVGRRVLSQFSVASRYYTWKESVYGTVWEKEKEEGHCGFGSSGDEAGHSPGWMMVQQVPVPLVVELCSEQLGDTRGSAQIRSCTGPGRKDTKESTGQERASICFQEGEGGAVPTSPRTPGRPAPGWTYPY